MNLTMVARLVRACDELKVVSREREVIAQVSARLEKLEHESALALTLNSQILKTERRCGELRHQLEELRQNLKLEKNDE